MLKSISHLKIHSAFNILTLLINFIDFDIRWLIAYDHRYFYSFFCPYIALQISICLFSFFHYFSFFSAKKETKINTIFLSLLKMLFSFVPLFEMLLVINFEFRYYFHVNSFHWSHYLKIIYLTLKFLLISLLSKEDSIIFLLKNITFILLMIINMGISFGFQNVELILILIKEFFVIMMTILIFFYILKEKSLNEAIIYKSALDELPNPILLIRDYKSKNQNEHELYYYNKKVQSLFDLDCYSNFISIDKKINGFSIQHKQKSQIHTKEKSTFLNCPEDSFGSLSEILDYFNKDNKFKSMKLIRKKTNKDLEKISDKTSGEISLKIKKITIVGKDLFLVAIKELHKKNNKKDFELRLLTSLSHEMKTPLNGCLSLLQILQNSLEQDERTEKLMKNSLASLKLLENTVNNIIDQYLFLSEEFILCLSNVKINDLMHEIHDVVISQSELKSLNFTFQIDSFLTQNAIYTDNNRLKQVILNIILNSIQFTNEGFIKVEIKTISKNPIEIQFTIEDSGIGMSESINQLLLMKINDDDTNLQLNSTGNCMGLTISNKIIKVLGIKEKGLEIISFPNKGTTVIFAIHDFNNKQYQSLDINSPNKKQENIEISESQESQNHRLYESIIYSSILIDAIVKKNKLKNLPENIDLDSELRSFRNRTIYHKLKTKLKIPDFDSLKKRTFWIDNYSQRNNKGSGYKSTSFQAKGNSSSHTDSFRDKQLQPIATVSESIELKLCFNESTQNEVLMKKNSPGKNSNFILKINECVCKNILIVDDDAFNLLSLEMILKIYGYNCAKATNGSDAIYKVKNNKCDEENCHGFKLILMDYQMPIMDGVQSTKEILKIVNIPIIGVTAFTTKEHIMNCFEAGMKDVIFKPINKEVIGKVLEQWIP